MGPAREAELVVEEALDCLNRERVRKIGFNTECQYPGGSEGGRKTAVDLDRPPRIT